MRSLKSLLISIIAVLLVLGFAPNAWAFCGFYVSKADAKLYNQASQVVLARDGDRTIITMANDYQGEVEDFALVVPVPSVIKQEQVHYKAMFQKTYEREDKKVAFLEYAWNMGSCDPCAADPLSREELKEAGVFWLDPDALANTFITRLHVRYTRDKFPEDLIFQETSNGQLFQGRYVLQHPFTGEMKCEAANNYQQYVRDRQEQELQTLAQLTGWNIRDLRRKAQITQSKSTPFWRDIWKP